MPNDPKADLQFALLSLDSYKKPELCKRLAAIVMIIKYLEIYLSGKVRYAGLILATFFVPSCGNANDKNVSEVQPATSLFLPADNHIHMSSVGRLKVSKRTMICGLKPSITKAANESVPDFYEPGLDGHRNAGMHEIIDGRRCDNDGGNMIAHWAYDRNRNGRPYRLVLAIWQGDLANGGSMITAGVERPSGKRPDSIAEERPPQVGDGPCCEPSLSIQQDISEIAKLVMNKVMGDQL